MARWIRFLLALLIGAAGGLFYGWVISPVEYVDTTPDSLKIDYKSDYVLMVAEAYSVENDVLLAMQRLGLLGGAPGETVRQAVLFAEREGFLDSDVALMKALQDALAAWNPALETPLP